MIDARTMRVFEGWGGGTLGAGGREESWLVLRPGSSNAKGKTLFIKVWFSFFILLSLFERACWVMII